MCIKIKNWSLVTIILSVLAILISGGAFCAVFRIGNGVCDCCFWEAVSSVAALVAAFFSGFLLFFEMSHIYDAEIIAEFAPPLEDMEVRHIQKLSFVLKNVGKGVARDVRVIPDVPLFYGYNQNRKPINNMEFGDIEAGGSCRDNVCDTNGNILAYPYGLTIEWRGAFGRNKKKRTTVCWKDFSSKYPPLDPVEQIEEAEDDKINRILNS